MWMACLLLGIAVAATATAAIFDTWPFQGSQADATAAGSPEITPSPSSNPGSSNDESSGGSDEPTVEPQPTPDPKPEPEPDAEFTILAAGDVLLHIPVTASARKGNGYDFLPLLAGIDSWVQGADLALCHMEIPVAPEGQRPSGYPMFGAPRQIVPDLAKQGWDGCSLASNHTVDKGWAGIETTVHEFEEAGLGYVGASISEHQQSVPQIYELERSGQRIRVAHLSVTYGTNGLPIPAGKPWSVDLIDADRIIAQATEARTAGADLVLVSVHAGTEYRIAPTDQQLELAQELADSGVVDLYIGHHAHISQPMTRLDGGPRDEGMWVAYGLGNMLSNQSSACCVVGSESGLMMIANVVKPADGPARVAEIRWQGITVDLRAGHRVFPFAGNLKSGTTTLSAQEMKTRRERVASAVGDDVREIKRAPKPTGPAPTVLPRDIGEDSASGDDEDDGAEEAA